MGPIIIKEEKCIGCGLCVDDCPNGFLFLENDKVHTNRKGCIECGHCFAICPQGAVRMANYECSDEPIVPMTEIDSDKLLAAMKSRRSMRHFTGQPVEQEKIDKILEAGRYSPTGGNSQGVYYTVLGSRQKEAESICLELFRNGRKIAAPLAAFLRRVDINDNFFFKGAPLVIVLSGRDSVNPGLASSYMEIMAESMGLGVLYSGFFVACSRMSRKLRKLLDLPKGHKVVTCMVIGYPSVKYDRIVPRKPVQSKTL